MANSLKWPQEFWPMLLQSVFVGKTADVYSSLSEEQSCDYATVKKKQYSMHTSWCQRPIGISSEIHVASQARHMSSLPVKKK